jgi:hypothetical protein
MKKLWMAIQGQWISFRQATFKRDDKERQNIVESEKIQVKKELLFDCVPVINLFKEESDD